MESGSSDVMVTAGEYILWEKLGGRMSTVWKAEHRTHGQAVALKQVRLSNLTRTLKISLDCERNFLSSVHHPNIVRLLDVFQAEGCVFLVLEFCAGGDLASYIRLHGRVQEQVARKFMQQLGAGLKVLNSHHIIHRDLKPEAQCFVKEEQLPQRKLRLPNGTSRLDIHKYTKHGSGCFMASNLPLSKVLTQLRLMSIKASCVSLVHN
ncbi:hypothetical protein TEA_004778 [Camellia sinensis var. sinensis]|uniref:Protein kinase domain-containing protein n=1 Tax=Camellia sinensis var. sinensis TaxID=542762 RepID=A0A4S4DNR3_CAMSN|nr:hypothetical protein TEA_004778 [Camellia sinensis var. sinensis]